MPNQDHAFIPERGRLGPGAYEHPEAPEMVSTKTYFIHETLGRLAVVDGAIWPQLDTSAAGENYVSYVNLPLGYGKVKRVYLVPDNTYGTMDYTHAAIIVMVG
jgi:hypothetical protein